MIKKEKKSKLVRTKILPSSVFLKLKLAVLSMEPVSYWAKLRQNSTSAADGSLGVLDWSWFPGLRISGPSGVPSHKACWLLYSSGLLQMICEKHFMLHDLSLSQEQEEMLRLLTTIFIHLPDN